MKENMQFLYVILCSIVFVMFGHILPHSSKGVQVFLEQLTGYGVLFTLAFVGYKAYIVGKYIKSKTIRTLVPTANACLGIMYMMWLIFDYGSIEPHVAAIGFNIPTIAQSLAMYLLLVILKAEKNVDNTR